MALQNAQATPLACHMSSSYAMKNDRLCAPIPKVQHPRFTATSLTAETQTGAKGRPGACERVQVDVRLRQAKGSLSISWLSIVIRMDGIFKRLVRAPKILTHASSVSAVPAK